MTPPFTTIDALSITQHTLVGPGRERPTRFGNCFSVLAEDGEEYRILNFHMENLEYGLKKKYIEWPVKIHVLSKSKAVIHDERIPNNWYEPEFCNVCTPHDLLTLPQKLRRDRDIASGQRREVPSADGEYLIIHQTMDKKVKWPVPKSKIKQFGFKVSDSQIEEEQKKEVETCLKRLTEVAPKFFLSYWFYSVIGSGSNYILFGLTTKNDGDQE